jgi:hypothetical protein
MPGNNTVAGAYERKAKVLLQSVVYLILII